MKRRFPLHVHISTLFIVLILLVGGVIAGLGYRSSQEILATTADDLNTRIGRETLGEFTNLIGPAEMATRLVSHDGITRTKTLAERLNYLGFMRAALDNSAALTSIYVGYGNGDFFMLRRFYDATEGQNFNAPAEAVYMVQSIEHPGEGSEKTALGNLAVPQRCVEKGCLLASLFSARAQLPASLRRKETWHHKLSTRCCLE